MNPVSYGGPFSAQGHSVKEPDHGRMLTVLRMAPGRYSKDGGARQAAAVAKVLNAYAPMLDVLQRIAQQSAPADSMAHAMIELAKGVLAKVQP